MLTTKDIGTTIRTLRKQQGLTGGQLGSKVGLSQAKISRIETGTATHFDLDEILTILNILKASENILQQAQATITADEDSRFLEIYRNFKYDSLLHEKSATEYRIYCSSLVPAIMQTLAYRKVLLVANGHPDLQSALRQIVIRQDMLWDKQKQVDVIVAETALYTTFTSAEVHRGQLDRLERLIGTSHLKFGIIPVEAGMPCADVGSFVIYDQKILIEPLVHRELETTDPYDVGIYLAIHHKLQQLASYGDAAIPLIRRAEAHFR